MVGRADTLESGLSDQCVRASVSIKAPECGTSFYRHIHFAIGSNEFQKEMQCAISDN
jgi:hypothetical protein